MPHEGMRGSQSAMIQQDPARHRLSQERLKEIIARAEAGARRPSGLGARVIVGVCLVWALFQLWYSSPLPYIVGPVVLNSTQARSIHLAFGIFLAFTVFPGTARGRQRLVAAPDWIVAAVASFCAAYLFLLYEQITARPAMPTWYDVATGALGLVLLLEATRRAIGIPLVIVALVFLSYAFFGHSEWLPDVIRWKGASLERVVYHQWLTTEGVFGVPIGVSTSFVFLFVLFGALLERAGAGNYFIKIAYALLGHMRGGPAKTAVLASGMMALISGSSIANTVTTGTFTIPLMKRVGFPAHKAGAVEVAASVDGQIMPPVMGAAAFLIMEYVGISYVDVIKHALLPAIMSYIGLLYIVHLEAVKAGMSARPRPVHMPVTARLLRFAFTIASLAVFTGAVYYGLGWIKEYLGPASPWVIGAAVTVLYLGLVHIAARQPDLETAGEEADALPRLGPTLKAGLHFLLPVALLIWMLLVERLSPSTAAFWAVALLVAILLTQRPLIAWFRREHSLGQSVTHGVTDLVEGLIAGPRNMIGVAIATAAAGIVVGTVTLTGIGQVLTGFVEFLSGGNVIVMLLLTALLCLILGMGLPTTANYIVVSSLMAPVIVQLGAEAGLAVELIAVHLFVFYFGLMADVTPPVGLAAFAASGISGADPIRTGIAAFFYSLRTAILPFIFIFNTQLLLIDVGGVFGLALTVAAGIGAMLIFAAALQNYFMTRSRLWESAALLVVAFTLLRPGYWMDQLQPPYQRLDPSRVVETAAEQPPNASLQLVVSGTTFAGESIEKTVLLPLGETGSGVEGLRHGGLILDASGERVTVQRVRFGSVAEEYGVRPGWSVEAVQVPRERPPKELMYLPALALLGLVVWMQRRRGGRWSGAGAGGGATPHTWPHRSRDAAS